MDPLRTVPLHQQHSTEQQPSDLPESSPSNTSTSRTQSNPSTTATNMSPPPGPTTTANMADDTINNYQDDDIWETTPPQSPVHSISTHQLSEGLTESSTISTTLDYHDTRPARREELLSDIPTLRRQHMTDGYREGLAVGKARVMQQGFDDGYPLGILLGWRCGRILGVLEGWVAGLGPDTSKIGEEGEKGPTGKTTSTTGGARGRKVKDENAVTARSATSGADVEARKELRREVQRLLDKARDELAVTKLMGGVGDEVVHGLRSDGALPVQVEDTVRKWEGLVLGNGG